MKSTNGMNTYDALASLTEIIGRPNSSFIRTLCSFSLLSFRCDKHMSNAIRLEYELYEIENTLILMKREDQSAMQKSND